MLIINTETKAYKTLHYGDVPDGWLEIPVRLEPRARAYCPYCELEIEDGTLTGITPTERPPEPEPEPTREEILEQQVADLQSQLLTLMTGG